MSEQSSVLQIAVTAALLADGGIGAAVYDTPAADAAYPYVRTGDDIVTPEPSDCADLAVSVRSALHVFSRDFGSGEARTIAGAIMRRLDNAALDLGPDWTLNTITFAGTRMLDEPDGSKHAVVTFLSLIDPA